MYKHRLFTLFAMFTLTGCFSSHFYVLSAPSKPAHIYAYSKHMTLGVEKITVPEYLFKNEIAVAESSNQIRLLPNATWGEDLDTGLTQRLIGFLQKKFNQPNVYAYPWGVDKQPNKKIKVNISRFIAQGDKVHLDANWEVKNLSSHSSKARLFATTVPTTGENDDIVSAMDKAFAQLEEEISRGVR